MMQTEAKSLQLKLNWINLKQGEIKCDQLGMIGDVVSSKDKVI